MRTYRWHLVHAGLLVCATTVGARYRTGGAFDSVALATPADATTMNRRAPRAGDTPARGTRKTSVLREYGAPRRRHEPVGQPPITRWDYADYQLYFEYDRVLHAVIPADPQPLVHTDGLVPGG